MGDGSLSRKVFVDRVNTIIFHEKIVFVPLISFSPVNHASTTIDE